MGHNSFVSLKGDCPVCSGTKKRCSQQGDLIHCRTDNPNPDYNFKGWSSIGFGMYKEAALEEEQSAERKAEWKQQRENERRIRLDHQKEIRARSLSTVDRNTEIRQLLAQLSLTAEHRDDLRGRGLSDRQIDAGMFRSIKPYQNLKTAVSPHLAGVAPNGRSLTNKESGYICPAWSGCSGDLIVGWQLRTADEDGKYKWATSKWAGRLNGPTSHLQNGELPVTVCRPAVADPSYKSIGLAEGVLKPWIASQLSGQYFLGAAGGQFASSPETFKKELDGLSAKLHTKMLVLYPDAGATQNKNVMREYTKIRQLVTGWGYELMIGWWGQKEESKISGIDDLFATGEEWKITHLVWEDYAAIADGKGYQLLKMIEGIFRPNKPKAATFKAGVTSDPVPDFYAAGDRVHTWKTAPRHKFIIDSSGTGTGKSYDAGLCQPADFDVDRLIYISKDHRNASTPSLRDWEDLEARHKGLKIDHLGNFRRAKTDDPIEVSANCDRTDLTAVLRKKNVSGSDTAGLLCPTCPQFEDCRAGKSFGFLKDRTQTLKSEKFRSHPDSLPQLETFGYAPDANCKDKGTGLIWEEWGETLRYSRDIIISEDDITHTLANMSSADPRSFGLMDLLIRLWEFAAGKHEIPRWGLPHDQLQEILLPLVTGEIDIDAIAQVTNPSDEVGKVLHGISEYGESLQDMPAEVRRLIAHSDAELASEAQKIAKQWLVDFLEVLLGRKPGYLSLDNQGNFTLSIADKRLIEIAHAAKVNIFLDATGNLNKFTKILGIEFDDVLCIAQKPVSKGASLTIKQVLDHGRLGQHRGKQQILAVEAMIAAIREKDPGAAVIDFKKFTSTGDGLNLNWLNESRGSNLAQTAETLIVVGTPCRPISVMRAEFTLLYGRSPSPETEEVVRQVLQSGTAPAATATSKESVDLEFRNYIYADIQANIHQGFGRLRANRRSGENLTIYFLSNFVIDSPVEVIQALDITLEAATQKQRFEMAIVQCKKEMARISGKFNLETAAQYCEVSKQRMSQFIRELGYATAADFKKSLVLLLDSNSKTRLFSEDYIPLAAKKQIELWAAQIGSLPPSVILALMEGAGMVSEVWVRLERIFEWVGREGRSKITDFDLGALSW